MKTHIKKDDKVVVISGEEKGKEGRVLSVDRAKNRAIVEGLNMSSKHSKPNANNPQGGIEHREAPIHLSNLMLMHKGEATKVGRERNDKGQLVRVDRKNREEEIK